MYYFHVNGLPLSEPTKESIAEECMKHLNFLKYTHASKWGVCFLTIVHIFVGF